ncbi:AraC-like ligand-binding domain-containing protein [Psychrobacter jeotgali]|uniref:AraC-like ligand-binding domain-containing protein n=1 Tax=Psychrobacter jeotgali TaxID=179010 RepID=UPI001918B141|nr:helix-turn-helix domain-containing protein [Psychrobacter jeotgali]
MKNTSHDKEADRKNHEYADGSRLNNRQKSEPELQNQQLHQQLLGADGWQRVINETYFDLKVQVRKSNQFAGQMQQANLAQMGISGYFADAAHYQRSGQHLSQNGDSILLTFPLQGSVHFEQQKRELTCHPGQFFIELSHQPYQFYHTQTAELQVLKVPIGKLSSHQRLIEQYFAKPITTEKGSGRLLQHQITHTLHLATSLTLSTTESQLLQQQLLDLIILTLHRPTLSLADSQVSTIKAAHLLRIENFIYFHLADPQLSPQLVAQACHISERYLHILFKEMPYTFAEWVKITRLAVANKLLIKGSHSSVADIGYQVGFTDQSYFSRIYKQQFGYSPKDTPSHHAKPH